MGATVNAAQLLEDWERNYPLTSSQRSIFLQLEADSSQLPWPNHLQERLDDESVLDNDLPSSKLEASSSNNKQSVQDITLTVPIETAQQFFDWFSNIEKEMEQEQQEVYRRQLQRIKSYCDQNDALLNQIEAILQKCTKLSSDYNFVEETSLPIKEQTSAILLDNNRLTDLLSCIEEKLTYFSELEPIARLFNSPDDNICLAESFIPYLKKLDSCIEFMETNKHYRDAELYLMKYKQCLTRGLTLIKIQFASTMKSTFDEVQSKLIKKTTESENMIFYVKFGTVGPTLKPLLYQLETRAPRYQELSGLIQECYYAYFNGRQQFILPIITAKIDSFYKMNTFPNGIDVLNYARSICTYLKTICEDEVQLYGQFFNSVNDKLEAYLESLSSYAYDQLRPLVIKENRIDILSELCTFLQFLLQGSNQGQGNESPKEYKLGGFVHTMERVLDDAQHRVCFRAQNYIKYKILGYTMKQEDLDYPNILKDVEQRPLTPLTPDVSLDESIIQRQEKGYKRYYFPVYRKSVWLLSKLYQAIDGFVFLDFFNEVATSCLSTLLNASNLIAKKSKVDGQLFLIKHLLLLHENMKSYELPGAPRSALPDVDLQPYGTTDIFYAILESSKIIFNPNALFGYSTEENIQQKDGTAPMDQNIDSRKEIDNSLKQACEIYITESANAIVEPLTLFIRKIDTIRLRRELKSGVNTGNEPVTSTWKLVSGQHISVEEIIEVNDTFLNLIRLRLPPIVSKMKLYISDERMEVALLKPILGLCIKTYEQFISYSKDEHNSVKLVDPPIIEDSWFQNEWVSPSFQRGSSVVLFHAKKMAEVMWTVANRDFSGEK